jgi:hypothetical protein
MGYSTPSTDCNPSDLLGASGLAHAIATLHQPRRTNVEYYLLFHTFVPISRSNQGEEALPQV